MPNDLLHSARQQAENAEPSIRAAALLRIARAETGMDIEHAKTTLLQALELIRSLSDLTQEYLVKETREVTAAVSPQLLAEMPTIRRGSHERFESANLVRIMLAHGHIDAAFDYLLHLDDKAAFPFASVGDVLQKLDPNNPERTARRMTLLRRAVEVWLRIPSNIHHERDEFVRLFGSFWKEFEPDKALAIARRIVAQDLEEPDAAISANYATEVRFTSTRQHALFQILHVLLHLDPALAQSLIDSHDQLAASVRLYPNGLETMFAEMAAAAERRKAEGATNAGCYIMGGDPADFDRIRRLMQATQSGNFEPSIEDAIGKYQIDTSPANPNEAPKEYWPSTAAFRTLLYQARKRLGPDAGNLLDRIPDEDIRLFATIELAAALAGLPESSMMQMKRQRAADSPRRRIERHRNAANLPTMRSPDGRMIRCPKCLFRPTTDHLWSCKCGHPWNTFSTAGLCPACGFQWEVTQCPQCGETSEHQAWYVSES